MEELRRYARSRGEAPFTAVMLRAVAYDRGIAAPPHERAWGWVLRAGVRQGIIRYAGDLNRLRSWVAGPRC